MKVSIHLTKASRGMTLRNLDLDTALALCTALRGLPGTRIVTEIVAGNPPVTHAAPVAARRVWCSRPRGLHTSSQSRALIH